MRVSMSGSLGRPRPDGCGMARDMDPSCHAPSSGLCRVVGSGQSRRCSESEVTFLLEVRGIEAKPSPAQRQDDSRTGRWTNCSIVSGWYAFPPSLLRKGAKTKIRTPTPMHTTQIATNALSVGSFDPLINMPDMIAVKTAPATAPATVRDVLYRAPAIAESSGRRAKLPEREGSRRTNRFRRRRQIPLK